MLWDTMHLEGKRENSFMCNYQWRSDVRYTAHAGPRAPPTTTTSTTSSSSLRINWESLPVNVSAALCQLPVWNKQTRAYLLQAEIGRIKLYAAY